MALYLVDKPNRLSSSNRPRLVLTHRPTGTTHAVAMGHRKSETKNILIIRKVPERTYLLYL